MAHSTRPDTGKVKRRAGVFDIRTFIAALIGLYGLVLVILGLVGPSEEQLQKSDGLDINLWAGLGMLIAAALFQGWAMWRPVVVPKDTTTPSESDDR